MFKIIYIRPTDHPDSEHRLPIMARCMFGDRELEFTTLTTKKPKKGEEYPPYKITCNCEEFKELKEALDRIGDGKIVEITLPRLKKMAFSMIRMEQFKEIQDAEQLFSGKTDDVILCSTGSRWNRLRIRRQKLGRRGNKIGETVEYYHYKFDEVPTFKLKIGNKEYSDLLPEVLEYIIENGAIPNFVEEARKKGELAILPKN